jgi:hypothetical protein
MVGRDWTMKLKLYLGKYLLYLLNYIYRDEEKNTDGSEKEITYGEYVGKINKRALEEQKRVTQARMRGELKNHGQKDDFDL